MSASSVVAGMNPSSAVSSRSLFHIDHLGNLFILNPSSCRYRGAT
jgi:hypothetical protein